jgi:recombinational DNA repair ATPase RecF
MRITKLVAENILKLRAISIVPKDSVIEIKGDNAQGKSSILDAIVIGLRGKKAAPSEPVKRGAKKGKIVIDMDGDESLGLPAFTITSKVTNDKIETIIEPKELLKGETPRSLLDKLLGAISFDPLDFINKEGKEQRKTLLNLIGVDVDSLDQKEKSIYDNRTAKNRELKPQAIKVDGLKFWPEIKETKEAKISELSEKLTKAMAHNNSIITRTQTNEGIKLAAMVLKETVIPSIKNRIKDIEIELAAAKARLLERENEFNDKRKQYNDGKTAIALLKPIVIDVINQEIQAIEATNSKIRDNNNYQVEKKLLTTLQSEYDKLDTDIETVRQERITLLQSANMPVPGLSFDESGLLFNDIPLSQGSDGEELMVSMGISMALNPTMKVLRIKDGSLLGPKNMGILREMVKDKGYQLWIEKVQDRDEYGKTGKVGIFIEEGECEGEEVEISKAITSPTPVPKTSKAKPAPLKDEDW